VGEELSRKERGKLFNKQVKVEGTPTRRELMQKRKKERGRRQYLSKGRDTPHLFKLQKKSLT